MPLRTLLMPAVTGALLAAQAVPAPAQGPANTLTPAEEAAGWRLLFDGRTTEGWRGFKRDRMPDGWQVVDGALTRVARGGDIVTVEQYRNFELALEWMVAPGGNSGIFYRVEELPGDTMATWKSGPEMQVLDDAAHRDGLSRLTAAGSAYGLYEAPAGIVRPAGEWNQVRILVNGNHVEHWLNGRLVVSYVIGSPEFQRLMRSTKFRDYPRFARAPRGHVALQDHGDRVAYRSIRIRVLP